MQTLHKRYISVICVLWILVSSLAISACTKQRFSDFIESYQWKARLLIVFSPNVTDTEVATFTALYNSVSIKKAAPTELFIVNPHASVSINGRIIPSIAAIEFNKYFQVLPEQKTVIFIDWDGTERTRTSIAHARAHLHQWLEATPKHYKTP